jgi:RNA polymerase sigma-70 factor (ECF subfamily)
MFGIATHVCLDMRREPQRRALPMDLAPSSPGTATLGETMAGSAWLTPLTDGAPGGDPADIAISRETIRLAFVAALQLLPPRQRAVLILRDVLRWRAAEVAELLDASVPSVNSALQRARSTLATANLQAADTELPDEERRALLDRYVDAFERFDIDTLVSLLHEDATLSMPPYTLWLRGSAAIYDWFRGPGAECRGERLVAIEANGSPGFAVYRPTGPDGGYEPFSIQVLELHGPRVSAIYAFLEPQLFTLFHLPAAPAV